MKKDGKPLIDVSDWGGPDIPRVLELNLEPLQKQIHDVAWKAFSDGIEAFLDDLAIELHENGDICIYETAGFEDVALIPAAKMAERMAGSGKDGALKVIMIKDYLT